MKQTYQILKVPNPLLRRISELVTFPLDPQTREQIYYLQTCFRKNFVKDPMVGLAAPQVGISKRFFIIANNLKAANKAKNPSVSSLRKFDVYINPQIVRSSDVVQESQQNCISVPDLDSPVIERHSGIAVKYFSTEGEQIQMIFEGFRAMIFQHQLDHLDGITVDQKVGNQKR